MKAKRLGLHAGTWATVLALLLMSIMPVMAEEQPDPVPVTSPLSGEVTIYGETAPDGSEVRVLVGDETEPRGTGVGTVFGGEGRYEILLVGDGEDVGEPLRFQVKKAGTVDWIDAATDPADPRFARYDPQIFNLTAPAPEPKYTLTVTVNPAVSGTVSLNPEPDPDGRYTAQTEVTLTATPAAGWRFDRWSGDVTGTEPVITLTMDADKSVTAHFARVVVQPPPPVRYILTVTVDPAQSGTVSLSPLQPAAGYLAGTTVTLTAEPAEGWEFERWSGDAVGTEPVTTVTMTRHKSVTAHFVPVVPLPAEVVEEIAEIPPEVAIPEETIKDIEERPLQEALEIVEGVSPERAAEITEGVSIERAAEIIEGVSIERGTEITEGLSIDRAIEVAERVGIERAVEITQKLSIERAAEIVDKVVIERAVEIIEGVNLDRAVQIIEEISRMKGTIDRAVEILEKVSLERATEIVERLSIETAVEIVKRLSIERASGIVEKVSIERASEIIKGVPLERAMEILAIIEKVHPERWELLPKPIFELSDLLIEPLEVAIGEEVTISAEVENVGELKGKELITLKVAEVVVETEEVELGPGEATRVEFRVVKMDPGIYPVEIEPLVGQFTVVVPPPPTIERVVPDSGIQGATVDVVISGEHFTGATAVSFGEGITVNRFDVVSPTRIDVNISIAADAEAGPRDVSVTTPGGEGVLPGGFTVRDVIPPTVVSTLPEAGARHVPVDIKISVTFSEDMDAATINAATFTLMTADGTRIAGRVTYDPATRTATFIPHENLAHDTVYTATITTGARDLVGNGLAQEFSWSFTTRPEPIDLAPIIEGVATAARVAFTIAVIIFAFLTMP
ncbi:Ig-like domain-containing protein [Dehalococcoidia bacterium]|nr:Ig-like domain-containing protein [Dehalococcoidia bacterium]